MLRRQPVIGTSRRRFCSAAASAAAIAGSPGLLWAEKDPAPLWQPSRPSDEAFLGRAIDLARRGAARGDGTPYGAVIVRGRLVVGEGWNRSRANNDPTAHAEVEAIRDAARRLGTRNLSGCLLYANGGRPCPMCETAAYWAGLERIFHGVAASAPVDAGRPRYGGC